MIMAFPAIDPVAIGLGPIDIRWYGLSYIAGILLGWQWMKHLINKGYFPKQLTLEHADRFISSAIVGILVGGRLGYVLFYTPSILQLNPVEVLYVWEGGMSFHGGLIGVCIASLWFTYRHKLVFFILTDALACAAPIGLFFGRVANFINGELYGRITDVPWAMVFPFGGPCTRHPSQVYEALLEGVALFLLINACVKKSCFLNGPGRLSGLFLLGYGLSRFMIEFVREPDAHLGYFFQFLTLGQILSLPLMVAGLYFLRRNAKS